MARDPILDAEVDAGSSIDETLMKDKIKLNDDDHEVRILALEGGGAGGALSDLALEGDSRVGRVLQGCFDNTKDFKWFKFPANSNIAGSNPDKLGSYDPEGDQFNLNLVHKYEPDLTSTGVTSNAQSFNAIFTFIQKNEKRFFKVKKGLNWFAIGATLDPSLSDSITVKIDGVGLIASGALDKDGEVFSSDTFSTNTAATFFQNQFFFFGLDKDKEQLIEFENTDSAAKRLEFSDFSVGYATEPSVLQLGLGDFRQAAGKVLIRGSSTEIAETSPAFDASVGYGRIDSLVSSTAGVLSVVKGAEGGMVKAKLATAIDPTTSTVNAQNIPAGWPSKGIVLAQFPRGVHHKFSFTGTTRTLIHDHKFDGVIWENDDWPAYTPNGGNQLASNTLGSVDGDVVFILLADGTENAIEIDSTNNKLDWKKIVDGGSETTHAITIPDGLYSADLMPLGKKIVELMDSTAPLADKGSYFFEYSKDIHKWIAGVRGTTSVDSLSFPVASGVNEAVSVMKISLGWNDTDLSGAFSYISDTEKENLAWRTYDRAQYRGSAHPTVKYTLVPGTQQNELLDQFREYHGISTHRMANASSVWWYKIYPHKNSCGVELYHGFENTAAGFRYSIDNGEWILGSLMGDRDNDIAARGAKSSGITLTWPLGTVEVEIAFEPSPEFQELAGVPFQIPLGYRELKPHPALERLTTSQAAYKFKKIRPRIYYEEWYDHDVTTIDKIDNVTKTGSWVSAAHVESFNGSRATSATLTDQIDIEFTLVGEGGCGFILNHAATDCLDAKFFLVDGTTPSIDDAHLMQRVDLSFGAAGAYNRLPLKLRGLPAGPYVMSIVVNQASQVGVEGYAIIDDVESEPDANEVTALTNSDRTISWPITGVDKISPTKDGLDSVPTALERTPYNRDKPVYFSKLATDSGFLDSSDTVRVYEQANIYGAFRFVATSVINNDFGFFEFAETLFSIDMPFTGHNSGLDPIIDGRTDTQYSQRVEAKGGGAHGGTHRLGLPLFKKNFFKSISMSDSTTVVLADTKGVRIGMNVLLVNTGTPGDDSYRRVTGVTTDVSFTINKPVSGTFGDYDFLNFAGFHNLRYLLTSATGSAVYGGLAWTMLPVQNWIHETLKSNAGEKAFSMFTDVTSGIDIHLPIYKDGTTANFEECIFELLRISASSVVWDFSKLGWRDPITVGTADIRVTATRRDA